MSWSFRKRITIAPGVRINLGKRGVSLSVGRRGLGVTVGKNGTHLSAGIPGTGLSVRTKLSGPKKPKSAANERLGPPSDAGQDLGSDAAQASPTGLAAPSQGTINALAKLFSALAWFLLALIVLTLILVWAGVFD